MLDLPDSLIQEELDILERPSNLRFEYMKSKEAQTEYINRKAEWQKYIKNNRRMLPDFGDPPIEYCWPLGAPLTECLEGQIDEAFMQPLKD